MTIAAQHRTLRVKAEGYEPREVTYQGRKHWAVPVVALVEGVVHAMNAESPELVAAEEFSKNPVMWNGRPVFHGHPMRGGKPVIGNDPEILESEQIGVIFNSGLKDGKLVMEAWVDEERAQEIAPELLARLLAKEPIEISVGLLAETTSESGTYDGKKYKGKWINLVSDHLALLPEESVGACSRDAGCGVRAAAENQEETVSDKRSLFARAWASIRAALKPEDMSDNDKRRKLYEALRKIDPRVNFVEAIYDTYVVYCVYEDYYVDGYPARYYRRDYSLSESGEVSLGAEATQVEPTLVYEPVGGSQPVAAQEGGPAATGAPSCSCQDRHNEAPATEPEKENKAMADKKARVQGLISKLPKLFTEADQAFLEGASEEQLARFEAQIPADPAPVAAAAPKVEEIPVVQPKAAEAPKTAAEYAAAAPEAYRAEVVAGVKAAQENRAATITTLKASGRCKLTDEQLATYDQAGLDQLVELAGGKAAEVDYSGRGPARATEQHQEAPAAPSLVAAIQAQAAGKK